MGTMMYAIIAFVVIILMAGYYIGTNNKLERQQVKIQEADSGIDVALTKRYDTLNKLLDVTRGYVKHEQEVILQAVKLRQNMSLPEKVQAEERMAEVASQINLLAESYPVLTAQAVFVELQKAVTDTEEHLQAARRLYNSNISVLNQLAVSFPSSIVAGIKGVKEMPMFVAEQGKREDISMKI